MCCDKTVEYSVSDGCLKLAAGNFGDWHSAVGKVLWSLVPVPKTSVNSQVMGKLVLWDFQPLQVRMQQP